MPIAIIQNGTREDEKLGVGTISTIEQIVVQCQLSNPAIIVVGEVVNHRSAVLNYAETLQVHQEVL
jgi:uroporphyrin-III C-methyltransferase